jgi:hypothetical protein
MKDTLPEAGAIDIRSRLSVRPREAGTPYSRVRRRGSPLGGALHYNGPKLLVYGNPEKELRFVETVVLREHQNRLGADSVQYHYVVLSNGQRYQTRGLTLTAWHCGNGYGNDRHLAVHLTLGKGQTPTAEQWASTVELFDILGAAFGWGRRSVFGHNEYPRSSGFPRAQERYALLPKQSECPGPILHQLLVECRTAETQLQRVRVTAAAGLTIRQGPGREYPRVAALPAGTIVETRRQPKTENDGPWLWLTDGRGFIARWFTEPVAE